jgi:hypothetical protein
VAFGITAPLASVTVPLMFPVALWPNAEKLQNTIAKSRQITEVKIRLDLNVSDMVVSPLKGVVPNSTEVMLVLCIKRLLATHEGLSR